MRRIVRWAPWVILANVVVLAADLAWDLAGAAMLAVAASMAALMAVGRVERSATWAWVVVVAAAGLGVAEILDHGVFPVIRI